MIIIIIIIIIDKYNNRFSISCFATFNLSQYSDCNTLVARTNSSCISLEDGSVLYLDLHIIKQFIKNSLCEINHS